MAKIETKYYPAQVYAKEALCPNCGGVLQYVQSDFARPVFSWRHACPKCKKSYWLNNRYPLIDYGINLAAPVNLATDPIEEHEEAPDDLTEENQTSVSFSS